MPGSFVTEISSRIKVKPNRTEGIENFDIDNSYPQHIRNAVNGSGMATSVTNKFAEFIEGNGAADTAFYKAVINSEGMRVDQLIRKLAADFALNDGFAFTINRNALLNITEIYPVPFEFCRMADPESKDYAGKIAIYNDWGRERYSNIKKDKIRWMDRWSPNDDITAGQISNAGGFSKWNGQIFWFSRAGDYQYPLAVLDSVFDDVQTDGEIQAFKLRSVNTNFLASHIFVHMGTLDKKGRQSMEENLQKFQGGKKTGKIMMVEADTKEQIPQLLKADIAVYDKLYEYTEKSVRDNIRKVKNIPTVLLGDAMPGTLGLNQQMIEAEQSFSKSTNKERRILEETFAEVFPRFEVPVNTTNNYSIIPIGQAQ